MSATQSPTAQGSSPRPYLHAMDGLRWLAAMHVVVFHTMHAEWLSPRLMRTVTWGFTSTSLLFVMSGFVLVYTYADDDGLLRIGWRDFWWRRLSRLVPLTLVGHLLTAPLVWGTYAAAERGPRALAVLFSVQAWIPDYATSFNSPGWSVSAMLLWYALLPGMLMVSRRWTRGAILAALGTVWAAAMVPVAAYLLLGGGDRYWYSAVNHHPVLRLPEFAFGVLLAALLRTGWRPRGWMLPVGLAGWVVALLAVPDRAQLAAHNGLFAPLHGLVLLGIAAGGGRLGRALAWRPLARGGEAGFAIFLLHVPIYSWVILPLAPALARRPAAVRWSAYLVFLALTAVLSWAVQRWLLRALTMRLRAARGRTWPIPA